MVARGPAPARPVLWRPPGPHGGCLGEKAIDAQHVSLVAIVTTLLSATVAVSFSMSRSAYSMYQEEDGIGGIVADANYPCRNYIAQFGR
jgi:hypothetical protein